MGENSRNWRVVLGERRGSILWKKDVEILESVSNFWLPRKRRDNPGLKMSCAFSSKVKDRFHREYGSIIFGAIRTKFAAKGGKKGERSFPGTKKGLRGSFSFKGGMRNLPDMLCKYLSHDELNLDSKVLSLSYNSGSIQENWSLSCDSHNETQRQNVHYDVVMTAPLCNVKEMKLMKGGQPFQLNFLPEGLGRGEEGCLLVQVKEGP